MALRSIWATRRCAIANSRLMPGPAHFLALQTGVRFDRIGLVYIRPHVAGGSKVAAAAGGVGVENEKIDTQKSEGRGKAVGSKTGGDGVDGGRPSPGPQDGPSPYAEGVLALPFLGADSVSISRFAASPGLRPGLSLRALAGLVSERSFSFSTSAATAAGRPGPAAAGRGSPAR